MKYKYIITGVAIALHLFLSQHLFADDENNKNHSKSDAKAIIKIAENRLKRAQEVGHEWTKTAPLLEKAKKALKKGDNSNAFNLAYEADMQAIASIKQWIDSNKNWKLGFPK